MELAHVSTVGASLTYSDVLSPRGLPSIPSAGLAEVLASFSGPGALFTAVASMADETTWTTSAIRIRANRVLLAYLVPLLERWPTTTDAWINALPAESSRQRELASTPRGRIDWARTRAFGWPPSQYFQVLRERLPDGLLLSAFAWTVVNIRRVQVDAKRAATDADRQVRPQVEAAITVWSQLGAPGEGDAPGRPELAALRASGFPWTAIADVAELLVAKQRNVFSLASELLVPHPELRSSLFHLGCVGQVLLALRAHQWTIIGVRPIGIGNGPVYRASKLGRMLDIWYEVGAAYRYYGQTSPYAVVSAQVGGTGKPIGADIGIFEPRADSALLLECKCSFDRTYVFRNGYEQALAYLAECRTALARHSESAVVGPDEVVTTVGSVLTEVGRVSVVPASAIEELLLSWLGDV